MNTEQGTGDVASKPRRKKLWVRLFISVIAVFAVAFFFVGVLQPLLCRGCYRSRKRANEASAVGLLRSFNTFQSSYATTHPTIGFACQLAELRQVDATYDPPFLASGTQSGYRFAVTDCQAGPTGIIMRYQATAIPLEPGKSGVHAFCTDETGVLWWYEFSASAANCPASRRLLD